MNSSGSSIFGRKKASQSSLSPYLRILAVFFVIACLFTSAFLFRATTAVNSMEYADKVIGQSGFLSAASGTALNEVNGPAGVAFDASGNLWVADSANDRILEFHSPLTSGELASIALGQTGAAGNSAINLNDPRGIAFDSSGDLWVADSANNRVVEFVDASTLASGAPASLVIGQPAFGSSTAGTSFNQLSFPEGLAFDSSGNLWVADTSNNRVLEFNKGSGFADGGGASLVLGQPNFTASGSSTSQSGLNLPTSIAFDSSSNLWVSDSGNSRILEFSSLSTNDAHASLVIGQSGFTTGTSGTSQTTLNFNEGIAFDGSGNLWVADLNNNRMLEFSYPLSTGESASAVLGQSGFTTNTFATTQSGEYGPNGLAFDPNGNLWLSDFYNNRALEYPNPVTVTTTSVVTSTVTSTSTSVLTTTSIPPPSTTTETDTVTTTTPTTVTSVSTTVVPTTTTETDTTTTTTTPPQATSTTTETVTTTTTPPTVTTTQLVPTTVTSVTTNVVTSTTTSTSYVPTTVTSISTVTSTSTFATTQTVTAAAISLNCDPSSLSKVGKSTLCEATVIAGNPPAGVIAFSAAAGIFGTPHCSTFGSTMTCFVSFTPSVSGVQTVTAKYESDPNYVSASASDVIKVGSSTKTVTGTGSTALTAQVPMVVPSTAVIGVSYLPMLVAGVPFALVTLAGVLRFLHHKRGSQLLNNFLRK